MKTLQQLCAIPLLVLSVQQAVALSLAPEEFKASRQMACVLAQQSLGQLSEQEYSEKANSLLDGFDDTERDYIIAQAVGYFGGLMFSADNADAGQNTLKLEDFVASSTCTENYSEVTFKL